MAHQGTLYPLEFYVAATPRSLQASSTSKKRWSGTIAEAARERIRATNELGFLYPQPLSVSIYYFPIAPMVGDVDNIVKPILDAMVHVAYLNDKHIERVIIQKFEPMVDWEFGGPSAQLTAALDTPPPVVYVRVDDDLSWRSLE
jgi:crossover junction endodeoxyribonuclease RusA